MKINRRITVFFIILTFLYLGFSQTTVACTQPTIIKAKNGTCTCRFENDDKGVCFTSAVARDKFKAAAAASAAAASAAAASAAATAAAIAAADLAAKKKSDDLNQYNLLPDILKLQIIAR
jgi:hypothetical protein